VDFYCDASRLVVELDGPIHDTQVEYDRERDAYLTAHNLRVLRVPNDSVFHDPDNLLRAIRNTIALPSLLAREGMPPQRRG
jgi:very-short-patch-repair endonuclease